MIFRGRYTAQIDGSFVVFLIGMRVNKMLRFGKWLPVARAMPAMIDQLLAHRDHGLLHAQALIYWRGAALVQYWRSFEQLERFARDPSLAHLDAWKRFNRAVGADGSVGIWHETYLVEAGRYECIYGNMPRFGLAAAGEHLPALGTRETAKRRLGLEGEPAVASYENPPPQ
jgi:fumigallin biosynthesis monooxygenase-like protein